MWTRELLAGAAAAVRQSRQPREFRIPAAAWPEDALATLAHLAALDGFASDSTASGNTASDNAVPDNTAPDNAASDNPGPNDLPPGTSALDEPPRSALPGLDGRTLADLATSMWRLRNRMQESPDAPRSAARHAETAWDTLAQAGVEVQDHLHEPFDPGLSLVVLAFQPTAGLRRDQVIETIRPSVYLHDRVIQTGEVIVGTPDPPAEPPAPHAEESRS
jgi:hypothetical protein